MRPLRFLSPLILLLALLVPGPARATFHVNEITKIMVGYNGDDRIQAVELKSLFSGENLVSGISINVYDGAGNPLGTAGTFTADVANAASGAHILCATRNFEQAFGITADLRITGILPVTNGQVSFEKATCLVNAVAYGDVPAVLNGPTAAPPLPAEGATALARVVDNSVAPSCPLGENAAAKFVLTTGGPGHPIVFTNNAGQSVDVSSTVVGVESGAAPAALRLAVAPNPAQGRVMFAATSQGPGRLRVYSIRGRLVWEATMAGAGRRSIGWDGRSTDGGQAPSGVYQLDFTTGGSRERMRFLFLR
jgi:hypothetical protein